MATIYWGCLFDCQAMYRKSLEVWAKVRQKCYQPCCRLFAYLALEESRETAQPTGNHSPENNKIRIRKTQKTSKPITRTNWIRTSTSTNTRTRTRIWSAWNFTLCVWQGPMDRFGKQTNVHHLCLDIAMTSRKRTKEDKRIFQERNSDFRFLPSLPPKKCKKYSAIGLYSDSKMDLSKCVFNYCFLKNNTKISPWWWFIRDVSLVQSSRQGHKHMVSLPQALAHRFTPGCNWHGTMRLYHKRLPMLQHTHASGVGWASLLHDNWWERSSQNSSWWKSPRGMMVVTSFSQTSFGMVEACWGPKLESFGLRSP